MSVSLSRGTDTRATETRRAMWDLEPPMEPPAASGGWMLVRARSATIYPPDFCGGWRCLGCVQPPLAYRGPKAAVLRGCGWLRFRHEVCGPFAHSSLLFDGNSLRIRLIGAQTACLCEGGGLPGREDVLASAAAHALVGRWGSDAESFNGR